MRILHYILGFPPYRSGGLTNFSMDLMHAQLNSGDSVAALWPGTIKLISKREKIVLRETIDGIESYELVNPLPVPLDEGIIDIEAFTKKADINIYLEFLKSISPDAIHIHTLMGMHKEFVLAAKQLGIRTIFTTHDYFGLCPKVTLFRNGRACDEDHNCADCKACNLKALSLKKITVLQSPVYRKLKETKIVKKIRKKHRNNFFNETEISDNTITQISHLKGDYQELRSYYIDILNAIDTIHCNSSLSMEIFNRYYKSDKYRIITISNKEIKRHSQNEYKPHDKLILLYLSPAKSYKGYMLIRVALDELWAEGIRDFELHVYTNVEEDVPYLKVHKDGFSRNELENIFSNADVLLAPSIWYETFGFTVLEALSYNLPVIVSDHVGSKDIIGDGGIIVSAGSKQELKKAIKSLSFDLCVKLRNNIIETAKIKTWDEYVKENQSLYL